MKPLYNLLGVFILLLLGACHNSEDNHPPKPKAAFTISGTFRVRDTIRFVNSSSNADSYYWDFGDGGNSTKTSPGHTFQRAGHFTVKLEATGAGGTDAHTADVDIVYNPPAGYVCDCKVSQQYPPGPYTALPNEVITIGNYGNNGGIEFKGVTYDLLPGGATPNYIFFRSTLYAASVYGSASFYPANDSISVFQHCCGIGGGMNMLYRCKKR